MKIFNCIVHRDDEPIASRFDKLKKKREEKSPIVDENLLKEINKSCETMSPKER